MASLVTTDWLGRQLGQPGLVVVDSTFPLAQAAEAHRRMETSQHIGKIVLTV